MEIHIFVEIDIDIYIYLHKHKAKVWSFHESQSGLALRCAKLSGKVIIADQVGRVKG